jgi:hypothetical protein
LKLLFGDGDQHVDCDGTPDLRLHIVLAGAEETFDTISVRSGKILDVQAITLPPGGVQLVLVLDDKSEPMRLVIQSHLVMARPLVFRIQNLKLDVFHG